MVYGSDLEVQDFEGSPATARYNINSWVARNTKNRIENIISSDIPQSTRMILANALYFKAFWETDFIESATRPDNFYPNGEGTEPVVRVQMMATGGSYPYHEDHELGCKIIGLPYRGNLSTMYIIQPFKSSVVELMTLQKRLTPEKVEDLISRMYRRQALVAFPKMHLTESVNLKTVMQKMGLGGIFSTVQNDLSLIATNEVSRTSSLGGNSLQNLEAQRRAGAGGAQSDLVVDDIVHKVDFTVNEQGTEAAASTVTYLKKSGPDVLFRGDTPFMVLVRHDPTKLVLF
ncbi:serine protease inhibitor 28Dc [Drosophila suzukii]